MSDDNEIGTVVELVPSTIPALGTCSDCVFAAYWPPERPGAPNRLVCHRYPHPGTGWPYMQPDDWCGEFVRRSS